jgi:hypothetical protein
MDYTDFIVHFSQHFEPIAGCSEAEIEQVRLWQRLEHLPEAYAIYLKIMGKGVTPWRSPDSGYADLETMKYDAIDNIIDCHNSVKLPDDALVFLTHQHDIYWFMLTRDQNNNPPVYGYQLCDKAIKKCSDSFTAFLQDELNFLKSIGAEFPIGHLKNKTVFKKGG